MQRWARSAAFTFTGVALTLAAAFACSGCGDPAGEAGAPRTSSVPHYAPAPAAPVPREPRTPAERFARAGLDQVGKTLYYDAAYVRLDYPGGDVPMERGVCCDVIIRAFRAMGIDLQVKIHEDMKAAFREYPKKWGLSGPDRNIDHRRVLNIETWLERQGKDLPVTDNLGDYHPGDIVTWRLPPNSPHIGIVTSAYAPGTNRHGIVHNVGAGAKHHDALFRWPIAGHYRYFSEEAE